MIGEADEYNLIKLVEWETDGCLLVCPSRLMRLSLRSLVTDLC